MTPTSDQRQRAYACTFKFENHLQIIDCRPLPRLSVIFSTLSSTPGKMCQTVVARHNCLHRATHIKNCATVIEKDRGTHNRPMIWTRMTSFLPGTRHRIEPSNPNRCGWDEVRLTICPGCRKLGYKDSQGSIIQEREDAKRRHARDIQRRKSVGQDPRFSAPTAPSRVPPPVVKPPPRLAARLPHRSRFAEVSLAPDTLMSAQETRSVEARQNAVRGHSTEKKAQRKSRRPAYHRRMESKDVGRDLPITTPTSITSRDVRRNRGESKPLPPIPLHSQKQVFGRANSNGKQSIPRKPVVAPQKSKGRSPPPPPLRLPTFDSTTETSPHSIPIRNTSWQHSHGDVGRLRSPKTAQKQQISRIRESTVNAISPLSAVICNAQEDLYTAPMNSNIPPTFSRRTALSASYNTRVDSLPRLAPMIYRTSTSPPPSLRLGRREAITATAGNVGVNLDSVEEMFNTAASQAQARNQVRDWQRRNTTSTRTSTGRRSPRQSSSLRTGRRT